VENIKDSKLVFWYYGLLQETKILYLNSGFGTSFVGGFHLT